MATRNAATYKDIQRITGLSLATISKFYNGGNVLTDNRELIEAAAASLSYRVNANASSLRRGTSGTVGVLLPSLQNAFHLPVIVGVEKYLREQGISVLVSSNEGESSKGASNALDLLLGRQVDGIIAVPAASDVDSLARAVDSGVPVVTIDWWEEGLRADSVSLDNLGAGRVVGQYIVDHGHHHIGIVAGDQSISTMRERRDGFIAALAHSGRSIADDLILTGPLTVDSAYSNTMRLLASQSRPTALFAANYDLTVGALIAINESGLRLGKDISMVGFDSVELARVTRPNLTVLAQPIDAIAEVAARTMSARIEENEQSRSPFAKSRIPGTLVVGASVASLHE